MTTNDKYKRPNIMHQKINKENNTETYKNSELTIKKLKTIAKDTVLTI